MRIAVWLRRCAFVVFVLALAVANPGRTARDPVITWLANYPHRDLTAFGGQRSNIKFGYSYEQLGLPRLEDRQRRLGYRDIWGYAEPLPSHFSPDRTVSQQMLENNLRFAYRGSTIPPGLSLAAYADLFGKVIDETAGDGCRIANIKPLLGNDLADRRADYYVVLRDGLVVGKAYCSRDDNLDPDDPDMCSVHGFGLHGDRLIFNITFERAALPYVLKLGEAIRDRFGKANLAGAELFGPGEIWAKGSPITRTPAQRLALCAIEGG